MSFLVCSSSNPDILKDKTMNDKLMYIPNEYDDIYDEHITKTTIIG